MARDHILCVLDLRSQSHYQLLGHSLWTRLVGSFDFSSQFLPDLTIFLFHTLCSNSFDIWTVTKPDRAQQSCQTYFISYKWVCNSHHRVSVVTELCYHSNHGTTSLQSYPIQTTHPALRASWLTTSTSITDNVLASSPGGGPTIQGSSSESKDTQRYSTVHPEDCTDWKRLPGLTRKRKLYDTKSVNGTLQGYIHQPHKEISTTLVLWRTWCAHGRHNVIRSPSKDFFFSPTPSIRKYQLPHRNNKPHRKRTGFIFC